MVVVPSLYTQQIFRKFGVEAKVIFNVVNQEDFPFKRRHVFKPSFIVSRNLEKIYNIPCVLRAFKLIQTKFPAAELTILGSGSQEESLKSISKRLKLRNVEFTGIVEHRMIKKYYHNADFMLNASVIDNMPISILEAFSSGIPIVSTEAGGIAYMIKDGRNGMLSPLNDQNCLAEKAIYLVENQDVARRISENAYEDCIKLYSWRANWKKWLSLYAD
jgi:glycosyltransferase involved in cell wall biosynthesis